MKTYKVKFLYFNDLREDWEGKAINEHFALSKAYEEKINLRCGNQTGFWTDFDPGFRITIERVK